jgi:hypothetical protein
MTLCTIINIETAMLLWCISSTVADPGKSTREGVVVVSRGSEGCLKSPCGSKGKVVVGIQGAKPPEANKFLQVKGVFSLNLR